MGSDVDWQKFRTNPPSEWTKEEVKIADLLSRGTSTPEIARIMGQHRSMIWRKIQRLKASIAGKQ